MKAHASAVAVFVLATTSLQSQTAMASTLEDLFLGVEAAIDRQAATALEDYRRYVCGNQPINTQDSSCYIDGCKGGIPSPTCSNSGKNTFGGCNENYKYVNLNYNKTRITFATDPSSSISSEIGGELMWTSGLTNSFITESNNNPDTSWQYIGLPSGTTRLYPASLQETCYTYDPRIRPWYVAATSGPKDVVIVFDKSGSMSGSRLSLTKEAIKSVLTTLTINDYVAIVSFDSTAQQLCSNSSPKSVTIKDVGTQSVTIPCGSLVQATAYNKGALEQFLDNVNANGGTNFLAGVERGFPLFESKSAGGDVIASRCSKAMLFLTDGEGGSAGLTSRISELNGAMSSPAVLFTYSLGSGASQSVPKQMACDTNGIWSPVADANNIRGQMSHFYDYFAGQRASGTTRVTWVEPYIDAYGAGEMTTASKAIYDNTVSPPLLIGVIGIDVLMTDIRAAAAADGAGSSEALISALARRSSACVAVNITDQCSLANLRKKDYSGSSVSTYSRLLGGSSNEDNRLCSSDPTSCPAHTSSCNGLSSGIPPTLTTRCNADRTDNFEEATCGGVCAEANSWSASDDGLSDGAIAGIIVGVLLCVLLAGVAVYLHTKPRKPRAVSHDPGNIAMYPPNPSAPTYPQSEHPPSYTQAASF